MMYNLGLDLGRTIKGPTGSYDAAFDNAFEVIAELVKQFDETYIVSRVNSEQKMRAHIWFEQVDFFNKTGIKPENVYFCFDRRDKAIFVRGLGITVFVDDRPTVLMHMDHTVKKVLFNPWHEDVKQHWDVIHEQRMTLVNNWLEVKDLLSSSEKEIVKDLTKG